MSSEVDSQQARIVGLTHAVNELAAAVAALAEGNPAAAAHATQARLHLLAAELIAADTRADAGDWWAAVPPDATHPDS